MSALSPPSLPVWLVEDRGSVLDVRFIALTVLTWIQMSGMSVREPCYALFTEGVGHELDGADQSVDATQERAISDIVDDVREDHLVSGFAGSGKTIVLTLEFPRFVMQGLGDHPTRTAYSLGSR